MVSGVHFSSNIFTAKNLTLCNLESLEIILMFYNYYYWLLLLLLILAVVIVFFYQCYH